MFNRRNVNSCKFGSAWNMNCLRCLHIFYLDTYFSFELSDS
uniref:Uncharacterized protein n=1 Tax=Rhizophora mucronata TaxID=61149 RepID=A0A2P2QIZ4_RHIMU